MSKRTHYGTGKYDRAFDTFTYQTLAGMDYTFRVRVACADQTPGVIGLQPGHLLGPRRILMRAGGTVRTSAPFFYIQREDLEAAGLDVGGWSATSQGRQMSSHSLQELSDTLYDACQAALEGEDEWEQLLAVQKTHGFDIQWQPFERRQIGDVVWYRYLDGGRPSTGSTTTSGTTTTPGGPWSLPCPTRPPIARSSTTSSSVSHECSASFSSS